MRPVLPTSEALDDLRRFKRFPLAVDWISEAQRCIKDKRAFVDYVSRLQESRYWSPNPDAKVERADDRYLGVWLNGLEERQARWYLKENVPCYVVREVFSHEREQLAALETLIDFAAGTSASSIHWSINEYDSRAMSRGDLLLPDTTRTHDPGWIWPTVNSDPRNAAPLQSTERKSNYGPDPPDTVIVSKNRLPWIKPPPVKKAEPSRPGAPPHEKKKWRKFVEMYHPEGTFKEISMKNVQDHRSHTMYDREKRWQILFLRTPKAPPGCVSDINVYGQPCPFGKYKDLTGTRRSQPSWIYNRMEPQTADIGRVAPTPRPEDLPLLGEPPKPDAGDDSDDDDDDYYPDPDFKILPAKNSEPSLDTTTESAKLVPAAPVPELRPAALGTNIIPEVVMEEPIQIPEPPIVTPESQERMEDEVSLGEEDSGNEAMGPQIPTTPLYEEPVTRMEETIMEDPLEFATSHLMIYGVPTSEGFASIQTLVANIASRLQLSIRRVFRTVVGQGQSFWLELGSVDQARQLRNYMHHRRENGVELLVSFANYENYIKALTLATHTWSESSNPVTSQDLNPPLIPIPTAGPSAPRTRDRERIPPRNSRRASPSPRRNYSVRRSRSRSRHRSPSRPAYSRRRHPRSPSPYYRNRSPYWRPVSPPRRVHRSPRPRSPARPSPLVNLNQNNPTLPAVETRGIPPLPLVPGAPAVMGLSPDAPLPFGANLAFMWSPSGNTLMPVILQGNTTVIPYPTPPSAPIPSALLPWPIAATLPALTMRNSPTAAPSASTPSAAERDVTMDLASRITTRAISPPDSPQPVPSQSTLMSRMTSDLATRLSDPIRTEPLLSRLSNPHHIPLVDRLESSDRMDVESSPAVHPLLANDPNLAAISERMATAGPLILDPAQYDYPRMSQEDQEEDDEDETEELGYKRTKRGRRSGQRIQGYRRRDEEREERRRRNQRRR